MEKKLSIKVMVIVIALSFQIQGDSLGNSLAKIGERHIAKQSECLLATQEVLGLNLA